MTKLIETITQTKNGKDSSSLVFTVMYDAGCKCVDRILSIETIDHATNTLTDITHIICEHFEVMVYSINWDKIYRESREDDPFFRMACGVVNAHAKMYRA